MLVALALTSLVLVLVVQIIRLSGTATATAGRTVEDAMRVELRSEARGAFGQVLVSSDRGSVVKGSSSGVLLFAQQSVEAYPTAYALCLEASQNGGALNLCGRSST